MMELDLTSCCAFCFVGCWKDTEVWDRRAYV